MKAWNLLAALIAIVILAVMATAVTAPEAWQAEGAGDAEDFGTLVEGIFTKHVLALETLGALLTAAMIGAMVIARPMGSKPDLEVNYPTRLDRAHVTDVQHVSDFTEDLAPAYPSGGVSVAAALAYGGEEE